MELSGISYRMLYHGKGYIRLEVPVIRRLSLTYLFENLRKAHPFPVPTGIKNFYVNPLTGSIVITYKPDDIDILEYIGRMASSPDIREIIQGGKYEMPSPDKMVDLRV
jgi:hypothetical protein